MILDLSFWFRPDWVGNFYHREQRRRERKNNSLSVSLLLFFPLCFSRLCGKNAFLCCFQVPTRADKVKGRIHRASARAIYSHFPGKSSTKRSKIPEAQKAPPLNRSFRFWIFRVGWMRSFRAYPPLQLSLSVHFPDISTDFPRSRKGFPGI
uniref:Uncharacterized protein n=1 Tax=Candidatus Kentrum sp. MB TaxID=2138164 RepID=A0A451BBF7_9GAMM|nr:MAG: hypothetical protein BECKMB1821G_GA0114241_10141 [Candidatus Kentron sp. MB]VFK31666.1 MAG: hypothetical protein BECKMB1821I_GA0114274_10261 [Candidatus Kentron sp. MB]VFK75602.1 MAG: hypothetical protein BECKMB1821H_GA0114242_10271 [Candidatus Kentron sp. MB]